MRYVRYKSIRQDNKIQTIVFLVRFLLPINSLSASLSSWRKGCHPTKLYCINKLVMVFGRPRICAQPAVTLEYATWRSCVTRSRRWMFTFISRSPCPFMYTVLVRRLNMRLRNAPTNSAVLRWEYRDAFRTCTATILFITSSTT